MLVSSFSGFRHFGLWEMMQIQCIKPEVLYYAATEH